MSQHLANHRKRRREESAREDGVVAPLRQAETIADRDEEEMEDDEEEMEDDVEQMVVEAEEHQTPVPRKKSTERVRAFRMRKKLRAQAVHDAEEAEAVPRKTSTERVREFRRRKNLEREADLGGTVGAGNSAAAVDLEPMPGRSTDPGSCSIFPRPDPVQIPARSRGGTSQADSGRNLGIVPTRSALNESSQVSVPNSQETGTTATAGGKPDCAKADIAFHKKFTDNKLGDYCNVCERIWFSNDLRPITSDGGRVLVEAGHFESVAGFKVCQTCHNSLRNGKVPTLSTSNGFTYPEKPANLPPLDPITERLIAPRLPFMQIRRLSHARGSYTIIGQIINVPVDVNEMVRMLPRQLEDDYAFNVCIKKQLIHKSNYLQGYVKKSVVKAWLRYLINTPLYKREGIVLDESLMEPDVPEGTEGEELIELEVSEVEDVPRDVPRIPQQNDQIALDATKMNFETLQMYRNEMQHIKFHIIDEVSMVGAHTLNTAHIRLQDVYMIYDVAYGGVNVLNHRLRTIVDEVGEVLESSGPATTLMTINVQSLRAHKLDITTDPILPKVHFLALSETWLDDHSSEEIEGFTCIIQSKRVGVRSGGVAIYQNTTDPDTTLAVPHTLEVVGNERDQEFGKAEKYGDICAAKVMVMGTEVLLVSVYISPGTTTKQKIWFLARNLIRTAYVDTPMVVTGDFNLDITKQDSADFVGYMREHFMLSLCNDTKKTTTLGGTALDLTFTKNMTAEVTRYIAYFSYHRPMLSLLRPAASEPSQAI
ncbi:hypothetical protein quinque_008949 [Culex quinquefasciatus]